jgi:hypothetical protein
MKVVLLTVVDGIPDEVELLVISVVSVISVIAAVVDVEIVSVLRDSVCSDVTRSAIGVVVVFASTLEVVSRSFEFPVEIFVESLPVVAVDFAVVVTNTVESLALVVVEMVPVRSILLVVDVVGLLVVDVTVVVGTTRSSHS